MHYVYNDGGRAEAGFKGKTGDCVCRAIAIASGLPYREIYNMLNDHAAEEKIRKHQRHRSSARTGMYKDTVKEVMDKLGWKWVPTMKVGQGCKVHLTEEELPKGRIIVKLSRHMCAVIDGVVHDTYDPTRGGNRCVYGYYVKE